MNAPRCENTNRTIDRWTYRDDDGDVGSVFACSKASAADAVRDVAQVTGREPRNFRLLSNAGDEGVDVMTTCDGCAGFID